jgi:hypothetical protein
MLSMSEEPNTMRISRFLPIALLFTTVAVNAESKNPNDYPLRIHVFNRNETTFYHNRYAEEAKGEGRANLFEAGEPKGVDFTFDCDQKLKASFGYETYPAKWKKPGQELTVLLPIFGKSNAFFTCNFKTAVKDSVYVAHDGKMGAESSGEFKAWMVKHDYDPEHGKNVPVKAAGAAPAAKPE